MGQTGFSIFILVARQSIEDLGKWIIWVVYIFVINHVFMKTMISTQETTTIPKSSKYNIEID